MIVALLLGNDLWHLLGLLHGRVPMFEERLTCMALLHQCWMRVRAVIHEVRALYIVSVLSVTLIKRETAITDPVFVILLTAIKRHFCFYYVFN